MLPRTATLSESDEQRFAQPDKLSEMSLKDAIAEVDKQYLLCKKQRIKPEDPKWMLWSALVMRSWIARIQSCSQFVEDNPDYKDALHDNLKRKALFLYWWNRGAALKHFSSAAHIAYQARIRGIDRDAELLRSYVLGGTSLNVGQLNWISNTYTSLAPLVKRQILATIPNLSPESFKSTQLPVLE